VHVITDAGLTPSVIDVAAFAVENAFDANYDSDPEEVVALVNIGSQVVNINIVAGGSPAFTRDISTGGSVYTEEIQKALSVSWEEAERMKIGGTGPEESQDVVPQEVEDAMRNVTDTVLGEISRSLDFFSATAAESRIARVFLSGGGAKVSGLEAAFQAKTNLPVERLDPLARLTPASRLDAQFLEDAGPSLAVSLGLALRRMDD
jgi:type IV pilus assembly protein PilM